MCEKIRELNDRDDPYLTSDFFMIRNSLNEKNRCFWPTSGILEPAVFQSLMDP